MPGAEKPDLKELKKLWYQKLKDSGFKDAEDTSRPDSPLIAWHSLRWKNCNPAKIEAMTQYYEQARALLLTYEFQNPVHKKIWEMHCDGLSRRKIERTIKDEPITYKREQIGNIIKLIASTIL